MTIPSSLLLALLAAEPAATAAPPAPPPPPTSTSPTPSVPSGAPAVRPPGRPAGAPTASLPTVEGELLEVDHRLHQLRLRTAGGELTLTFDRNTLVLGPGGAATPLLLSVGNRVRAGREGEGRAAWVEVRRAPSTPAGAP